jgi:hypothetical protein
MRGEDRYTEFHDHHSVPCRTTARGREAPHRDNSKKRFAPKVPEMFIFCGYCAQDSR